MRGFRQNRHPSKASRACRSVFPILDKHRALSRGIELVENLIIQLMIGRKLPELHITKAWVLFKSLMSNHQSMWIEEPENTTHSIHIGEPYLKWTPMLTIGFPLEQMDALSRCNLIVFSFVVRSASHRKPLLRGLAWVLSLKSSDISGSGVSAMASRSQPKEFLVSWLI